ncbi:MAG: HRDC domain-containing protein [Thiotrichales bacterium]|nr:HRDC domain-containing protein [Thiotrichales bacterium]
MIALIKLRTGELLLAQTAAKTYTACMSKNTHTTILTANELNLFSEQLLANTAIDWIAIDTEFVRTDTYFAELSLVQIQDNLGAVTLIDPLAIQQNSESEAVSKNLAGLVTILSDSHLLKVFHAARQDIEVLYQLANKMPACIFDTQLAAVFFKHGDIAGFARVVEAELGVKLPKTQTRTNWHARPLTDEQIEYAIDDVRFLAPLYEKFKANLTAEQLTAITEDCNALLDETLYKPDPSSAGGKVKGVRNFKPKQLAMINALAEWRENYAIANNRPKKWVMNDEVMVCIVKRPPQVVEALYKVPQIKSSSVREHGQEWIELIDKVFAMPPESWPQLPPKEIPPSPQQEILINLAMVICQQIALENKINLHNLINKQELSDLICQNDSNNLKGWRGLMVGKPLKALLASESQVIIQKNKLVLSAH